MLTGRAGMVAAGTVIAVVLLACDPGTGDTATALSERVTTAVGGAGADDIADRLAELGVDVDAGELRSLEPADVRCPEVRDPAPGDQATCLVALAGEEVSIDVEFGPDAESVTVVRVEVVP